MFLFHIPHPTFPPQMPGEHRNIPRSHYNKLCKQATATPTPSPSTYPSPSPYPSRSPSPSPSPGEDQASKDHEAKTTTMSTPDMGDLLHDEAVIKSRSEEQTCLWCSLSGLPHSHSHAHPLGGRHQAPLHFSRPQPQPPDTERQLSRSPKPLACGSKCCP